MGFKRHSNRRADVQHIADLLVDKLIGLGLEAHARDIADEDRFIGIMVQYAHPCIPEEYLGMMIKPDGLIIELSSQSRPSAWCTWKFDGESVTTTVLQPLEELTLNVNLAPHIRPGE